MPDADMQGFLEFLAARDGEADPERHALARREQFFAALSAAPVRSQYECDAERYRRNFLRRRPEPGLDDRLLWILASAKANRAERFAIGFAELYGLTADVRDPVRLHLHLQETYHTRILADVVAMFGLPVHPRPPGLFVRLLIRFLVAAPDRESWQLPVQGMGEMAGCTIFRALRDRGCALFADEPAVAQRIRLLYDEILADEISHVGYIAAKLGPTGRAMMRALYRLFGLRMAAELPEMVALFGREELTRRFRAPFNHGEMVAEFLELTYAAALI